MSELEYAKYGNAVPKDKTSLVEEMGTLADLYRAYLEAEHTYELRRSEFFNALSSLSPTAEQIFALHSERAQPCAPVPPYVR